MKDRMKDQEGKVAVLHCIDLLGKFGPSTISPQGRGSMEIKFNAWKDVPGYQNHCRWLIFL